MTVDPTEQRRAAWSRYWADGALHSCATSYRDNYAGSIGAFWRTAFAKLLPGDAVLDVASGNGALPHLLLAARPEPSIDCDAVDLAAIAPAWLRDAEPAQRRRVRLHGGVAAESLPFSDGQFALVVSQYGLEYTDLLRTVPEALRVLRPSGRIRLVLHHAGSLPVRLANDEIGHIDWLLARDGLLDLAAAMIVPMARAATPAGRAALMGDKQANRARSRFNVMQDAVSARAGASLCPDVLHEVREAIGQLFRIAMSGGPREAEQTLHAMRAQLADSQLRLDELRTHAMDEPAAQALCHRLTRDGADLSLMPLSDDGHLMGWTVCVDPKM